MKIIKKTKKGFTLVELLVGVAIMGSMGTIGSFFVTNFSLSGHKQAAKHYISQVGMAAHAFRAEYNTYPCDSTADKVESKVGHLGELKGETSNPYFRQLFAQKHTVDEAMFYAALPGIVEGDEKIENGECLKPGENAFAYVMKKKQDSTMYSKAKKSKKMYTPQRQAVTSGPLLFCCVDRNLTGPVTGEQLTFDLEGFKGYAIVYNTDCTTVELEKDAFLINDRTQSIGKLTPDTEAKIFGENSQSESKASDYEILPPARYSYTPNLQQN